MRVESGGAFFSAELLIKLRAAGPERRRGRRAALPADRRLADRREAAGDLPRGARLLGAAAAPVGEPRARALRPRPARSSASSLSRAGDAGSSGRSPPSCSGSDVERVHEVAEQSRRGSTIALAGRSRAALASSLVLAEPAVGARGPPGRAPPRRRRSGPRPGPRARARPTAGRRPRPACPSRSRNSRAWNVSSASSEMTTRSTRAPSASRVAREQVVGEGPLRRQALETHRDRARLPRPDPDRQVALAVGLLEDHDVAAREHVDPNALDDHLDQLVVHGADYPTAADSAGRPRSAGRDRRAAQRRRPRRTRTRRCGRRRPPRRAVRSTPSEAMPSMSWRTNQKTEDDDRRHLDQLVEEPEEHQRRDRAPGEQHDVRAERRGDRARRADVGIGRVGSIATWVSAGDHAAGQVEEQERAAARAGPRRCCRRSTGTAGCRAGAASRRAGTGW